MKLTDEQLRTLASGNAGNGIAMSDADMAYIVVPALATEVLASRGRRCGNCALMVYDDEAEDNLCLRLEPSRIRLITTPDWHCADFTPKEAK